MSGGRTVVFAPEAAPSGERLAVLPEEEYLLLLAASEDDEGEPSLGFLEEPRRRRRDLRDGGAPIPLEALRGQAA